MGDSIAFFSGRSKAAKIIQRQLPNQKGIGDHKMDDTVVQLYPLPSRELPLEGLFLDHDLRQIVGSSDTPYVYTNFIASLDGRIAISHPTRPGLMVPESTANERDWRLYQELAAQSDLIISSGRYLRDWADGRAQEILQVDDPRFADLREWRQSRDLPKQPDIAIISGSLRFPIPDVLQAGGRKVIVFTTANPNPDRVKEIESKAGSVLIAGEKSVDGRIMMDQMKELGYRMIYSGAGPKIFHLLLQGGVVNRLYLTYAHRLLASPEYASIVEGELFSPAVDMRLSALYHDPIALDGAGQLFAAYDNA
jgi:riboflavin biosynthesis pyrimidine reductase